MESSQITVENVKGALTTLWRRLWQFLLDIYLHCTPQLIPVKIHACKKACTSILIAAKFIRTSNCKNKDRVEQNNCPLTGEWINTYGSVIQWYTIEQYKRMSFWLLNQKTIRYKSEWKKSNMRKQIKLIIADRG